MEINSMDTKTVNIIYILLLLIRYDIKNKNNVNIIDVIIEQLENNESYQIFKDKLRQIEYINNSTYIFNDTTKSDDSIFLSATKERRFKLILKTILLNLQSTLRAGFYEYSYDLVDAVHGLPQIYINSTQKDLKRYWKLYIVPFQKKWKTNALENIKPLFK